MQLIRFWDMIYTIEQEDIIRDFCEQYKKYLECRFVPDDVDCEITKTWWSEKVNTHKHETKYIYHVQTISTCDRYIKPIEDISTISYVVFETKDANNLMRF